MSAAGWFIFVLGGYFGFILNECTHAAKRKSERQRGVRP